MCLVLSGRSLPRYINAYTPRPIRFHKSDDAAAKLPLEVCGGGDEFDSEDVGGEGDGGDGKSWKWTGATSPVVWCPAAPPQDQGGVDHQRRRRQRRRRLGDRAGKTVADSPNPGEAKGGPSDSIRTERGWGGDDGGGDIFGGADRADFEATEWGWETQREGHRTAPQIVEGESPADTGAAAGAAAILGERGEEQHRRQPGLEPGGTRRGGGRLLRVERAGVVNKGKGGGGLEMMIERGLAEQQEEEGGQGEGEEGVEKDDGREREHGVGRGEEDENPRVKRPEEKEEEEEEEEEGVGNVEASAGAIKLAWIPGDPCSCVNAPGMIGEACRGWLVARARANFSPSRGGQSSDAEVMGKSSKATTVLLIFLVVLLCFAPCSGGGQAYRRWRGVVSRSP